MQPFPPAIKWALSAPMAREKPRFFALYAGNWRWKVARLNCPVGPGLAAWRKRPRPMICRCSIRFWPQMSSGRRSWPIPAKIPTESPRCKPVWPILMPGPPKGAPLPFSKVWALTRRRKSAPALTSQAAGGCGWPWRRCCFPRQIFCCWMSRPTISILRAPSGSKPFWRAIRIRWW